MTNGILTREALLRIASNPQTRKEEIPELGGAVNLRMAPASVSFEITDKSSRDLTLLLVQHCLVDGEGQPIYTAETVQEFLQLPSKAVERIMNAINEMNGWTAKAREELEKNSESQDDASVSDLPSVLA